MILKNIMRLIVISLAHCIISLCISCQESTPKEPNASNEIMGNAMPASSNQLPEPQLSVEDRILQIKQWYAEIQDAAKKEGMGNNCQVAKWREYEVSEYFDQSSKHCHFENQYELIQSNFGGWEWSEKITHYIKFGKVFFVLYESEGEALKSTYRIYYGQDGEVIKILEDFEDFAEGTSNKNKEIKDKSEQKDILQFVNNNWSKATNHLK
jgi:hypothetical protein